MTDGRPTCARCQETFTTWATFRYHVEFVCTHDLPPQATEDTNAEHRLRVAELLHFAATDNLQALSTNQDLCGYFMKRCGLCEKISLTSRGLFHHWRTERHSEFQHHGPQLVLLLGPLTKHSPCSLCGQVFQRQHQCVILRQIALLQTRNLMNSSDGEVPAETDHLWRRTHCPKVYTTKLGLQTHLQRYHKSA